MNCINSVKNCKYSFLVKKAKSEKKCAGTPIYTYYFYISLSLYICIYIHIVVHIIYIILYTIYYIYVYLLYLFIITKWKNWSNSLYLFIIWVYFHKMQNIAQHLLFAWSTDNYLIFFAVLYFTNVFYFHKVEKSLLIYLASI